MSTKCFFSPFLFRHITEQALFHARGAEAEQLGNWAMVGSSSPWLMGYGLFIFGKKYFFVLFNFEPNLFYLPRSQNRPSSLLKLTKPFA